MVVLEPTVPATSPTLRLVSQSQYVHTIEAVFGPDIAIKVRFTPVKRTDGLAAMGAGKTVVTAGVIGPLEGAARAVARQVVDPERRGHLVSCIPEDVNLRDDLCARRFFSKVGRFLYRRPLTEQELTEKIAVAGAAVGKSGDFYSGLAAGLSGMLISPNFLFIQETVEPDPTHPGTWRLDGYSKAARLSFLLWDATPDDQLLRSAERGDLHNRAGLRREVDRMLASPYLEQGVRAFFNDFFLLEAFDTVTKDTIIYPTFTLNAAKDAREQVVRTIVDHLITRNGDYRDLFTTRRTFISRDLGALYRLPVDPTAGWSSYEFAEGDPRAGLLTQVGFLAQYAHPGRSSPTRRGRGIREVLLCQTVPDPPPNVDFSIVEDPNAKFSTARERLSAHNTDPVCRGCHALTDPIGLGLEKFDGAGQFRQVDHGAPIDSSGSLDGIAFKDAVGLGLAVRNSPALKSCIINRLYAYSVGHTAGEQRLMDYFEAELDQTGYRLHDMLRLMVLSEAYFAVRLAEGVVVADNSASMERPSHAHQN